MSLAFDNSSRSTNKIMSKDDYKRMHKQLNSLDSFVVFTPGGMMRASVEDAMGNKKLIETRQEMKMVGKRKQCHVIVEFCAYGIRCDKEPLGTGDGL